MAQLCSQADEDEKAAEEFLARLELRKKGQLKLKRLKKTKLPKRDTTKFLVIPDSHAHPEVPNERFEALGNYIREARPDIVVDIGDSADLPSLFGVDKGGRKARFLGYRELWRDVESYHDAMDRLLGPIRTMSHAPRLVKVRGNHEYRISKALEKWEILRGFIGYHILMEEQFGWETFPFGQVAEIDGAKFAHEFPGSNSNTGARGVAQKNWETSVRIFGHTHKYGVFLYGTIPQSAAVNVGVFADPTDPTFHYAFGDSRFAWTPGIFEFEMCSERGFGWHQFTPLEEVMKCR